jgi:predicted transcriptional regulator
MKKMFKGRRSELDIITDILEMSKNGTSKTKILYTVNMSYSQLMNYLPFLIEKNVLEEILVKKDNKYSIRYKTTIRGIRLLDSAKKTLDFLR